MSKPGNIYVLYNPSAEGFVKIGKTTKDPEERAKELSSATGVPTPFIVVYKAYFTDCTTAESFVHTLLKDRRLTENKDFFRSSIPDAIQAVIQAEKFFINKGIDNQDVEDYTKPIDTTSTSSVNNEGLWRDIFDAANEYYYAWSDNILQDYEEALKLYKQAAKLGSVEAFHQIGDMYQNGEGVNQDTKRAIYYYKEAASRGDDICWGDMAICYYEMKEYENSDKCWVKLLSNPQMKGKGKLLGSYFLHFIEYMGSVDSFLHHEALDSFYQEIIENDEEKKEKFRKYLEFRHAVEEAVKKTFAYSGKSENV